jgi:hypothetical protein
MVGSILLWGSVGVVGGSGAIAYVWLVQWGGVLAAWLLLVLSSGCWFAIGGRGKSGVVLASVLAFLPLAMIVIGEPIGSAIQSGGYTGILVFFHTRMRVKKRKLFERRSTHIGEFLAQVRRVAKAIRARACAKDLVTDLQAVTILLIAAAFIVGPRVFGFLPPNMRDAIGDYHAFVEKYKPLSIYIAAGLFCVLSGFPFAGFLHDVAELGGFSGSSRTAEFDRWVTALGVSLITLAPFTMLVVYLVYLAMSLGHHALGFDFALLIGFFVFPQWLVTAYSSLSALVLLALPDRHFGRGVVELTGE